MTDFSSLPVFLAALIVVPAAAQSIDVRWNLPAPKPLDSSVRVIAVKPVDWRPGNFPEGMRMQFAQELFTSIERAIRERDPRMQVVDERARREALEYRRRAGDRGEDGSDVSTLPQALIGATVYLDDRREPIRKQRFLEKFGEEALTGRRSASHTTVFKRTLTFRSTLNITHLKTTMQHHAEVFSKTDEQETQSGGFFGVGDTTRADWDSEYEVLGKWVEQAASEFVAECFADTGTHTIRCRDWPGPLREAARALERGDLDGAIAQAKEIGAGTDNKAKRGAAALLAAVAHVRKGEIDDARRFLSFGRKQRVKTFTVDFDAVEKALTTVLLRDDDGVVADVGQSAEAAPGGLKALGPIRRNTSIREASAVTAGVPDLFTALDLPPDVAERVRGLAADRARERGEDDVASVRAILREAIEEWLDRQGR